MTGEGAQIGLWFTVALTFTASTIFIILRSYIRGKAELWSDWLNVLAYVLGVPFWVLIPVGLSHGLAKDPFDGSEFDKKTTALTFFLSQASGLVSVGMGRPRDG
ncbi:hypothetical protein KC353_g84 [Hortaea werneckii]|nr:hypothetical protein KC353_g84 [Hortaea werneckii]